MATATSTQPDEAHEVEVAKQEEIAAEVEATEAPAVEPDPEPEAPAEQALVTLQPKPDAELDFPIAVSAVGAEDDLIFTGPSDTVEVEAHVAEQITYSPAVEVAA